VSQEQEEEGVSTLLALSSAAKVYFDVHLREDNDSDVVELKAIAWRGNGAFAVGIPCHHRQGVTAYGWGQTLRDALIAAAKAGGWSGRGHYRLGDAGWEERKP